MEEKDLFKEVRKIEIKTKGLSRQLFSGEYHSAFKGRGMSFSEVRAYQYGDDVRNIDWNVTARYGETQVKVFEEEREQTLMLLIDISASSLYGTKNKFKSDLIAEISAVLAFSATANNDKVGAILFSDEIEKYVPPKKGKQNILRIIREILVHDRKGTGTDISQALSKLNNLQKKRSIAFVISDFIDQNYDKALTMAARRHDLIGLHIYDNGERTLPNVGILPIKDSESGKISYVNTSNRAVRNRFESSFLEAERSTNDLFLNKGADFLSLSTEDDYIKSLLKFFKRRIKG